MTDQAGWPERTEAGIKMLDILIRNGMVPDAATGMFRTGDVGIRGGRIVDLEKEACLDSVDVVDASGCYVTPGVIFMPICIPMERNGGYMWILPVFPMV